eukprot:15081465-Alexandrium_andersonii.AAC.1
MPTSASAHARKWTVRAYAEHMCTYLHMCAVMGSARVRLNKCTHGCASAPALKCTSAQVRGCAVAKV